MPRSNAPVSTSTISPEFAGDSMGSADVSICPFTVLAKGMIPWGDEVNVGTQPPLWGVGLWRDYIEGVNFGVGCREEWGLGKRHRDLDPIRPDHLEAGRRPGLIAIREACGPGKGSGRQE